MKKYYLHFIWLLILLGGCQDSENEPNPTPSYTPTPSVSLTSVGNISFTGASLSGYTTNASNEISWGVCWSESNQEPTLEDTSKEFGTQAGSLQADLTDLEDGKMYYIRIYIQHNTETYYSNVKSFTTLSEAPIVSNLIERTKTHRSARVAFDIKIGTSNVTSYGVCWSETNTTPTIYDNKFSYNEPLSEDFYGLNHPTIAVGEQYQEGGYLKPNTTYYVRAFARNKSGLRYSQVLEIKTEPFPLTQFTPLEASSTHKDIFVYTQILSTYTQIPNLLTAGFCWSINNTEPTIDDNKLEYQKDEIYVLGRHSAKIEGLQPNTTYYIRAFGQNQSGYGYSDVIEVTTNPESEVIATYLADPQKRTDWWNNLEPQWKQAFNAYYFTRGSIEDIPDDSDLLRLLNATTIVFSGKNLTNLSGLKDLEYLTELAFIDCQLTDFEDIKNFPNLTKLGFSINNVTSLTTLSNIKSLQHIDGRNNQITSLIGLEELTQLKTLKIIEGNNIPEEEIKRIEDLLGITIE